MAGIWLITSQWQNISPWNPRLSKLSPLRMLLDLINHIPLPVKWPEGYRKKLLILFLSSAMTSEETLLFSSPTKREEIYNRFKLARLSKLYVRILCLALFSICPWGLRIVLSIPHLERTWILRVRFVVVGYRENDLCPPHLYSESYLTENAVWLILA